MLADITLHVVVPDWLVYGAAAYLLVGYLATVYFADGCMDRKDVAGISLLWPAVVVCRTFWWLVGRVRKDGRDA